MSGEHANAASSGVIPSDAAFYVMNTLCVALPVNYYGEGYFSFS